MEAKVTIDKFLGLNLSDSGDTGLKLGELSKCNNIRIIDGYKARKRYGYTELFNSIATDKPIRTMWYGPLGGTYHFLFACNGYIYREYSISGTIYDSLDTATYTNVDVVKTTALDSLAAGTTGADGATIVKNSGGTELTEIAQANIDDVASVGKYYYHTDKTLWFVVAKGAYANIGAARTGLGTSKVYFRIGSLTDATTTMFSFNSAVYILNGHEYYKWTGSGAIATVAGYRPLVETATPPAGGGTVNEGINWLNGKKTQSFSGDGASTVYYLNEQAITSVDEVRIDGVAKATPADYSVNLTNGTVTFTSAPATAVDNVEIDWTKGSGTRSVVTGNKYYNLFGGKTDSRVFLYGDGTNEVIYSELADGVPSAEYFPVNNTSLIGSDEYPVTYITKQYDRQIIYTKNSAWYSLYEFDDTLGVIFPIYSINDKVGNLPYGQGQLIQNNPFTFDIGVYEWAQTQVRDEKNAKYVSERIQAELEAIDLSNVITTDYEKEGEMWIVSGTTVYIFNYRYDVWYKFTLADTPSCFLEIDGDLYMGTSQGQIMLFDEDAYTDNGTTISAELKTGFIDFGENWKRKFLNFLWVGLQPQANSEANIGWETDYTASSSDETIEYSCIDFGNVDLSDFTFNTSYNPKPFRLKVKCKKFTYLKIIISNDSTSKDMTILNITMPALIGGQSK